MKKRAIQVLTWIGILILFPLMITIGSIWYIFTGVNWFSQYMQWMEDIEAL